MQNAKKFLVAATFQKSKTYVFDGFVINESHPAYFGKSNKTIRLQPWWFFISLMCFYMKRHALPVVLSELRSQS